MTDRQSETNHLLVQIRDLLGDIALSIDSSDGYGERFRRYSDTFRRMQAEQSRLEKEHDALFISDAEQSRWEEEWFQELISEAKKYVERGFYNAYHNNHLSSREKGYMTARKYHKILREYPNRPEKWRSDDGKLLWESMGSGGGFPARLGSGDSLRAALYKRGRL